MAISLSSTIITWMYNCTEILAIESWSFLNRIINIIQYDFRMIKQAM